MKVVQKGYSEDGLEIFLIPQTKDERDKYMGKLLCFTVDNWNKSLGIIKITIKPEY